MDVLYDISPPGSTERGTANIVGSRDIGAALHGTFGDVFDYEVGVFGGTGQNKKLDTDDDVDLAARIVIRPWGDHNLAISLNGVFSPSRTGNAGPADLLTVAAKQSGEKAFAMAGLSRSDVDFCTIYDSFTITVLVTLECLGFCKPGEGGGFVEGGRIGLGGALPINPDGGGLSSNHPGMRGIFLVIEAARQLRGECDGRQVDNANVACVHGTGGVLGVSHSGATLLLARD